MGHWDKRIQSDFDNSDISKSRYRKHDHRTHLSMLVSIRNWIYSSFHAVHSKIKHSQGYDEISTKILNSSIYYISSPLTYIISRMLSTGAFPNRLKYSQVKPLFKTGKKNNISNYRLISLLTSFSKIFEKVIYKRLSHHINNNQILASAQFGFRHKSSTDLASYTLTQEILTALNNKIKVGGIFATCVRPLTALTTISYYQKWNFMV